MKNVQHFLLTRFNVRVNYSVERIGINPDWLFHRFKLFEQYCYPSVLAQTNSDFKWLVYFDADTPQSFKEKISNYAKWENFLPIYLDTEFSDQINQKIIADLVSQETDYVITTRMDNDDAISKDFIAMIQANIQENDYEFISFENGYVLNGERLYAFKYLNNPFMSLVERVNSSSNTQVQTILCGEHSQISKQAAIRSIRMSPVWLQVVHGRNVSNRTRGIRQPIHQLLDNRFVIDTTELPQQENLGLYWLDKTASLLKQPVELAIQLLPPYLKTSIKEILT
ncbi:MAG TPA: glycosyltransferase [Stenomitos sp.]